MEWESALPWIIALGGGTGIGAGLTALVNTVRAIRGGVSAREGKRRLDIVAQRDQAIEEARRAHLRADEYRAVSDIAERGRQVAVRNEQRAREHAADLRLFVIERGGVRRDELPAWPDMEEPPRYDPLTRDTLDAIRADGAANKEDT